MIFRKFQRVLLLAVIILSLSTPRAAGSGWNGYDFKLKSGYIVLWTNTADFHIWRLYKDNTVEHVTSQPGVGELFEIAMDDRFIFAKNYGDSGDVVAGSDQSKVFWTIIDHPQHVFYGPFSESEFQRKIAELNITQPIVWASLREAYEEALRDGRTDRSIVDTAFKGQLLMTGAVCLLLSPLLMLVAAPVGFALKRWKVRHGFLLTWFVLTAVVFAYIAVPFILEWHRMRNLWIR